MQERLRMTVQLIDVSSGSHIWAERYDRDLKDIFAVQEDVVRTMVARLVGRVQAAGASIAKRKPPCSLDAYDCVLRGNAVPWSEPDLNPEAAAWYEKAITLDPNYGLAHALLALELETRWEYDDSGSSALLDRAFELAKKAVQLDENESMGHLVLGRVHLKRRSFDLAEAHYRRAVEMNPNNPTNMADMGDLLTHLGRPEEAIAWLEKAKRVDPFFDPGTLLASGLRRGPSRPSRTIGESERIHA
jgi:adenylate cyclase